MTGYDFIGCAKRMGAVLIGRTEPSVLAVTQAASEIIEGPQSLRQMWNETVREGVPRQFIDLLGRLPEDGSSSNGGGRASH